MTSYPSNWKIESLDSLINRGIIKLNRGDIISKRDIAAHPGDYPIYSSAKENNGMFGRYGKYMFDEEVITWSIDGGGRLFYREKQKFSVTNVGGILRIVDRSVFDYKFLFYALTNLHSQVIFDWSRKAHPSVIRMVYDKVPIPPLSEQHKIIELLEDHLSRLDAALNDLQKARKMCTSLLAASFKSIVESVPHTYRPLSEVVHKIEAGKSFNCLGRPAEKEEWGVIKVSAMTWGEFLPAENKAAPLEYNPPPHHKINVGDILFSRANTQKYVGAAVRVKKEPGKLLLSDKSLRIIPKSDYDASWLLAALSSPVTRGEISKRATGNEDSMRNISQKNLLEVQIPVPIHHNGQFEVVESLSLVETGIASNLQIIEQNLLRMNQFRRSLLNKAFTGQLTKEVVSV